MLVTALAFAAPYRRARMLAFMHPWQDQANTGYQIAQSLIALGSGGVSGVGLGAGRAKWMFLPNAHTDFIFAVIGEELGLIGCLLVLALFAALGLVGFRVAQRAPDRFGVLLAAGVTAWIVGQAVINLGAVVGLLPVSGITLPFLSAGGSSLVITMLGAGILANVARTHSLGRSPPSRRRWPIGSAAEAVSEPVFALFTGGGTGGHTYRRSPSRRSSCGGGTRASRCGSSAAGAGSRAVVTEAGFAIDLLAGRGLQRRLTLANVAAIWGAFIGVRPRAAARSALPAPRRGRLRRVRVAAVRRRGACLRADARARAGRGARASRIGSACGSVRAPRCRCRRPPLRDATLTGNPVRSSIAAIVREPARSGAAGGLRRRAGRPYDQPRRDRLLRPLAGSRRPHGSPRVRPRKQHECTDRARRAAPGR